MTVWIYKVFGVLLLLCTVIDPVYLVAGVVLIATGDIIDEIRSLKKTN